MKLKPVVASLAMLGMMAPAFAAHSSLLSQQAIVNQNSLTSPVSSEGWANRISVGGVGSLVGIIGNHSPSGFFTTPNNGSDIYVNNLNLLVDANLSSWSKATLNLAYFGAPNPWGSLASKNKAVSTRSIYHGIVADEAYVQIANLAKYPLYLKVGKQYVPFGDYTDPYAPYQLMSPAQMLAQTNAVAVVIGVPSNFGLYANVFAFRGETTPVDSSAGNIRNFGAKVGYYANLDAFNAPNAHMNFNLSYIHNLWDSNVFSPNTMPQAMWGIGSYTGGSKVNHPANVTAIDPIGGLSAHADFAFKAFSMSANWVGAVKKMVLESYSSKSESSKFWAADVNANYAFKTFDRESSLGAGVQWTGNGAWFGNNNMGITDWARMIPKWRLVGEYRLNVFKNTDLGLSVAHGKSYEFVNNPGNAVADEAGSRNTTVGLARLMVQL